MSIEIEGLSPLQQEIAERIWALDSPDQLVEFFQLIPKNLLHDAYVVYHMIIWACLDEDPGGDLTEAQQVIEHIRQRPC